MNLLWGRGARDIEIDRRSNKKHSVDLVDEEIRKVKKDFDVKISLAAFGWGTFYGLESSSR